MKEKEKYALITGGSTGLGKELVIECAKNGYHIIMIALPAGNLQSIADAVSRQYGVPVIVEAFDMTDHELLKEKIKYISTRYPVSLLINNAGIGGTSMITESNCEQLDRIVQLNVRATVTITSILLPVLISQGTSHIMNIASMAAFTPIAYKTVYPASKAFISYFSLGLKEELKDKGVHVSAIYPGAIMTNSDTSKRIMQLGFKGKIGLLPTRKIAEIALRKTLAGKAIIIPGWWNRFNRNILKLLPPELKLKIVSNSIIKSELAYNG